MAELRDLLTRDDIVGGVIQVVIREEGVFRSPISGIEMSGETVHFKVAKTMKQEVSGCEIIWIPTEKKTHYYPASSKLMGDRDCQFDLYNEKRSQIGWVIVFSAK